MAIFRYTTLHAYMTCTCIGIFIICLQCIIGNKWNAVDCELSANFQASDAHGSYQATFNTWVDDFLFTVCDLETVVCVGIFNSI